MQGPTLGITTVIDLYSFLVEQGMPAPQLERLMGLSATELANPDARVDMRSLSALWEAAHHYSGDPAIGLHIGKQVKPEQLSIVAQTLLQSENLHQGLQQYMRFMQLVNETLKLHLSVGNREARIEFLIEPCNYHRSEIERTVMAGFARARFAMGEVISLNEVHFAHPNPGYAEVYEALFEAPVRFSQPVTALLFDKQLLVLGPNKRNPYLYQALVQHAENLLRSLTPQDNTVVALRKFIEQHLAHAQLDAESAAEHLHMSRHTLYRKLKKAGVSFQGLVEEVRHAQALRLLAQRDVSISEVAFVLGFSELSAFSRAFKRWTGSSPAHYRERAIQDRVRSPRTLE